MTNKNRQFTHLLAEDIAVWEQYLAAHGSDFDHFDYDVRVGDGRDPGPDVTDKFRRMALDLSERRIDVVAHRKDDITIIEVTHSAGFRAIGQTLGYPVLFARTFRPMRKLSHLLVAGSIQSDIEPILAAYNIPYWTPGSQ